MYDGGYFAVSEPDQYDEQLWSDQPLTIDGSLDVPITFDYLDSEETEEVEEEAA